MEIATQGGAPVPHGRMLLYEDPGAGEAAGGEELSAAHRRWLPCVAWQCAHCAPAGDAEGAGCDDLEVT